MCMQLGLLQQQNTELLEALQTREQEIQALKEVAEAQGELQSQDVQAAKIIELSKKVSVHCLAKMLLHMD